MSPTVLNSPRIRALAGATLLSATLAAADMITLPSTIGAGTGNQWSAQIASTVGQDIMTVDGMYAYYTGGLSDRLLLAPFADITRPAHDSIDSVVVRMYARTNAAAPGVGIRVAMRTNGSVFSDPLLDQTGTSWVYYQHTWALNPATSGRWTWDEITALQAGAYNAGSGYSWQVDHGQVLVYYTPNCTPVAQNVAINGTLQVGHTVSGSYTYSDCENDPEGVSTFRWYRADDAAGTNKTVISGATSASYTLTLSDDDKYVFFEVTPVAYEYRDNDGDIEGATTFRWLRNGVAIPGATDTAYTLVAADESATITFEVTPVALTGLPKVGQPSIFNIGPIVPADGSAPVADSVMVSGTPTVGETLTASYRYFDADGDIEGASRYTWYSGGMAVSNSLSYVLRASDEGNYVSFRVEPVAQTGVPSRGEAVMSALLGPVAPAEGSPPVADSVRISGTTRMGDTLYGSYVYGDPDGDEESGTTFRWLRNGVPVVGATGTAHVLSVADAGAMITFEVTPAAATGLPKTGAASASAPVGPVETPVAVPARAHAGPRYRARVRVFDAQGREVLAYLTGHAMPLAQAGLWLAPGTYVALVEQLLQPGAPVARRLMVRVER